MTGIRIKIQRGLVGNNQYEYTINGLTAGELRQVIETLRARDEPGIRSLGEQILDYGVRAQYIALKLDIEDFDQSKPD